MENTASNNGDSKDLLAMGSLIVGIIGLCAWFIPLFGWPTGVIALVLGYLGKQSVKNAKLAKIGMILGGVCLVLSTCNSALGVILVLQNNAS